MNEKHLSYFKVENFKRFESFEMNNIGQFNLILGDNNVGKTSVLEALLFDEENLRLFLSNLFTVLYEFRKVEKDNARPIYLFSPLHKMYTLSFSYVGYKDKKFIIPVVLGESTLIEATDGGQYDKQKLENIAKIYLQSSFTLSSVEGKSNIPYIPFHLGYDIDLVHFYNLLIEPSKIIETKFIKALQSILPNIESLKVALTESNTPFLRISQTDKDERIPLSMFGEGTIKLFRILMKIVVHRGKRLMIDEIDAGIHFKKFKGFWRTILLAAKQNEVQIFATTHNLECLQAFKEVLEETELIDFQQDARCFELLELPNKQIKAYTYNFEQFEVMIETGTNIRGGNYQNE